MAKELPIKKEVTTHQRAFADAFTQLRQPDRPSPSPSPPPEKSFLGTLASVLGGGEEADGSDDGAGLEKAKQFEIVFGVVLTIFATTVLVVHGNRVYSRLQAEAERENEQRTQSDTEGQQQPSLAPTPTVLHPSDLSGRTPF